MNRGVVESALSTTRWSHWEHHERIDSTQYRALQLARNGVNSAVVSSDLQTNGKGRVGRRWIEPDTSAFAHHTTFTNLAVTSMWWPSVQTQTGLVPLAAGLAVRATFRVLGVDPQLKWPNDVQLDGKKSAGILVEQQHVGDGQVVLVGCGLDLDWRTVEREGELASWTSVAEVTGRAVDRSQTLATLLENLDRYLDAVEHDPRAVLDEFRTHCYTLGQHVRVERPGGGVLSGTASAIDDSGALVVRNPTGLVVVHAGDVIHLRPADVP